MSEWVIVAFDPREIFQNYHGENKLYFQEMMMMTLKCCKQTHINIIVYGCTRPGLESMIYHTPCEDANYYTTDGVSVTWSVIGSLIIKS